jgi:chorismate mutase
MTKWEEAIYLTGLRDSLMLLAEAPVDLFQAIHQSGSLETALRTIIQTELTLDELNAAHRYIRESIQERNHATKNRIRSDSL